jgi:hypothetical protein
MVAYVHTRKINNNLKIYIDKSTISQLKIVFSLRYNVCLKAGLTEKRKTTYVRLSNHFPSIGCNLSVFMCDCSAAARKECCDVHGT